MGRIHKVLIMFLASTRNACAAASSIARKNNVLLHVASDIKTSNGTNYSWSVASNRDTNVSATSITRKQRFPAHVASDFKVSNGTTNSLSAASNDDINVAATSITRKQRFPAHAASDINFLNSTADSLSVASNDDFSAVATSITRKHRFPVHVASDIKASNGTTDSWSVASNGDTNAAAISITRKQHFPVHVASDIKVSDGIVDSPRSSSSLARKQQVSWSVTANGDIKLSDGIGASTLAVSPNIVRRENDVARVTQISANEQDEGHVIDDDRSDISNTLVGVTPKQPLVRKATEGHAATAGSIGISDSTPKLAFQLAKDFVSNSQELERMEDQAPLLLNPDSYNPFSQSFSLPPAVIPVGSLVFLGAIVFCVAYYPQRRWEPPNDSTHM